RVRGDDRVSDAAAEVGERLVVSTDLVEELDGDAFALDPDRVARAEFAELRSGPFRREILGQSAFGHLAQHGMQPADRPGACGGELMVSSSQQSRDLTVVLEPDRAEVPV